MLCLNYKKLLNSEGVTYLLKIVEHLNEECGEGAAPADKMRCFAELYPDLRKKSRHVYAALVNM